MEKKEPKVDYHIFMHLSIREKLRVISARTGKPVSELILDAVREKYFSGRAAVILPPKETEPVIGEDPRD